ncbi:unnamed protein product [Rotaria magnacalcarata]|uniref:ABC transmembrane type-1 domain-containing protein n=2 Tax=Rotaria magnacalcarata TaxID=392030 RepID=A0A8S2W6A1_9BILA|nr:unnamed protein product [Rotaria magnacalcarata]
MKSYPSNPSPFLYANKWSQLFHNWISVLINLSHKQGTVYLNDLYDILPEYESKQLTDILQNNWFDELKRSPENPSLLLATIRTVGWKPMMIGLLLVPNSTPLDIIAMIFLFWHFMNYISLIAIGYTVLIALIATLIGHIAVYYRTKILQVTDKRVKLMAEIIKSMRIVKMYCWESAINRKVRSVRKHEIIRYAIRSIFDSIQTIFTQTYITVTFLIIFGTMWLLNMHFDMRLFTVAACMLCYLEISLMEFGIGMHDLVHYAAAEKRIQKFLLLDEFEKDRSLKSVVCKTADYNLDNPMISPSKVECYISQASWEMNGLFSLKNVIFNAYPGDLICVIGPVGSGKSSLLQTLTNEITFLNGSIQLQDSFCYVPQEPWIFSSTVKENIIFGEEYNSKKFQRVIQAVALDTDFIQLPNGANTLVGDQGVMLSGVSRMIKFEKQN